MEELREIKREPKPGYIVLLVLNLVGFVALQVLNYINADIFDGDSK